MEQQIQTTSNILRFLENGSKSWKNFHFDFDIDDAMFYL